MTPEVVWFKRDLRITDHAPLVAAAKRGPVVCLYIYEPELIEAEDFSYRHLLFVNDSLRELDGALRGLGSRLVIRRGEAASVFGELRAQLAFERIRVHQETTNAIAYARDRRVLAWAGAGGVDVVEYRQQGVVRRLESREGWARQWQAFATAPLLPAPRRLDDGSGALDSLGILEAEAFGLARDGLKERQAGGESEGKRVLASFLRERSANYARGLSSPLTAWESCSRVSPYVTYGNLSLRTVYQQAIRRRREQQRRGGNQDPWAKALTSYVERLAWHCHFMQKLEDEPRIEFENMNPAFDGIRDDSFDQELFDAWAEGRTGYPMIDACMRALIATGWINFRMRAMLISFATHHLWLPWRQPALHLARLFVDYEPGIHYSQVQMQAGSDGISTQRICSPVKQVRDLDPQGLFLRRWLPELAAVPDEHLAEPHRMPLDLQEQVACRIGRDYPLPIVDHAAAYGEARRKLRVAGRRGRASGASDRVFQRHGSRRRRATGVRRR